jgi:transposase
MPVLLQLPLEIPEVEVLSPEFCSEGALLINVDSTRQGTRWGRCGRAIQHFHGDDRPIPVRHLPLRERRVYRRAR